VLTTALRVLVGSYTVGREMKHPIKPVFRCEYKETAIKIDMAKWKQNFSSRSDLRFIYIDITIYIMVHLTNLKIVNTYFPYMLS